MRPVAHRPFDEEFGIEGDPAIGPGIELDHPALDAVRVELRVHRAVKRVGEIDAAAVAADLNHLRPAVEPTFGLAVGLTVGLSVLGLRMRGPGNNAADADLARELGLE